ncbi:MAG: hypothetical protein U0263_39180 [Polyangiaceae bacterium]
MRGHLPAIASGAAVTVVVEYVEWLPVRREGGKPIAQYRFPMAAPGEVLLIGEFSAKIDTSPAHPRSIIASREHAPRGPDVRVRRPDFRPNADLVVDVEIPPWDSDARMYIAKKQGDEESSTVFVRADLPNEGLDAGATLALVVDTSGSAEPAELDVFARSCAPCWTSPGRARSRGGVGGRPKRAPCRACRHGSGSTPRARPRWSWRRFEQALAGWRQRHRPRVEAGADALPADSLPASWSSTSAMAGPRSAIPT